MSELAPGVWPTHARREADGGVSVAGVSARALAEEFGTPLFVIDEDDFRDRCRAMRDAFGDDAAVHYASKAFLSMEIARWVRDEGLNLDVCSGGELAIALRAGFPADRIALHGNNKSVAELDYAVASGIGHIVIDSLSEIARLDAIAGERGSVQDVLIRLTPGVEAHTHEFISTAHEDQKFGFSLASNEGDSPAMRAVTAVFEADNIRLVGLHSHIGSQIFDVDGFEIAARRVLELLRDIVTRFGAEKTAQLNTIDLGGGLGIAYTAADDPPPVADLAAKLRNIVETESAALGLQTPHLAVEPGRAIAGPPGITLYEVGTIKDVVLDGKDERDPAFRRYVSVDGGMSDNIRPALYGAEYTVAIADRDPEGAPVPSRIVGKHCETGDILVRDTTTPDGLAEGDLLAVAATGAYCYSMSSRYNMQPRPAVVAVKDGAARLILRRETVDDLVSLEVL
ncbi:Diaminopimelate decarboxylase OS=Tsukamurella paurometabola (strain ATCC 8368 / DSM / CCUG 35730/ CIP 100753 / JCM 10117 / KCTC 9821 / NBRC 16120 / NCIMB 702349 / NCTC 13040) OX=521096 GN=lysA PE=3 SV=1 [Tsukamurella paurometabola]|uniref:Diaminopimelate decarboxylase n=1 Tax=Tsukamurella paurometabola (strain ATCC 8368 / DSM 20162 / CCUG 35730 / CIP 100753 / JCM 10117 / KCTC 9821 / NBRC 16120 / NCIMB 702349 / NCTC 13040) TaxID=521096 RepID=D5UW53_TSUPD|nr:diaminopimelate decarboxylase [Tsukamurella paurometabola]ADG77860.1 diaminopimelate decarboxylase [Tsukamurella paurometabola DSM 20162]SUP29089.1 Diaminopimelate decarboxylase [Tsukamurella paurometabola]